MGFVGICEYCNKVIESDHEPEPKQNIEKGHFVRHYLICAACCRKFLSYYRGWKTAGEEKIWSSYEEEN